MSHDPTQHRPDDATDAELAELFSQASWDERYSSSDRVWSGNPNQRLVEQVADLVPTAPLDRALEVGCGEGADAIWLAQQGWQITGVDVSGVALQRAEAHAAERDVTDRTTWLRADLFAGDPLPSGFGLVTAAFMHLPDSVFADVYGALAGAVAPGGTLFVLAHHPHDHHAGLRNPALGRLMFGPEKVTALLEADDWEVVVAQTPTRTQERDGETLTVTDTVVRAIRR